MRHFPRLCCWIPLLVALFIAMSDLTSAAASAVDRLGGASRVETPIDALRARIRQCWRPPANAPASAQIILRIGLAVDGSIVKGPEVVEVTGLGEYSKAEFVSAAKRAVVACGPFKMLVGSPYSQWKDMELAFNVESASNPRVSKQNGQRAEGEEISSAILARAEEVAATKGKQYAATAETTWRLQKHVDEMTDAAVYRAISDQEADGDVRAEVSVSCRGKATIISAIILDKSGAPNVIISADSLGAVGRIRLNDRVATRAWFSTIGGFPNDLLLETLQIPPNPDAAKTLDEKEIIKAFNAVAVDIRTTWRVLAEVQTNHGPLLMRIPLYDDAVRQVVERCR